MTIAAVEMSHPDLLPCNSRPLKCPSGEDRGTGDGRQQSSI